MKTGANIVRRTSATDNYRTPSWATHALMDRERFPGSVLEPAAAGGKMTKVLAYRGCDLVCSDIRPLGMRNATTFNEPVDFLSDRFGPNDFDHVITNPPFSLAQAFAERALDVARCKVALLLRIQFLESSKRYNFLKASPLKTVYVFSSRLAFWPEGSERTGHGGTAMHAWFVWDHSHEGEPVIRWIPPERSTHAQ